MNFELETDLAKSHKKSNREIRKPKTAKPKPVAAPAGFLAALTKDK